MLLKIENLNFGWEKTLLLKDINARLGPGQIVQLMGPNGAGKTTLLHLIAGLIPHFHRGAMLTGDILIQGRSIMTAPPKSFFPKIAYVPSTHLDLFLLTESLHQELELTSSILKADRAWREQRLAEFAEFFPETNEMWGIPFKTALLQQKILALTLIYYVQQAQLFLFDEIFPSFSAPLKAKWLEFFQFLGQNDCTVIFVDHQRATNHFGKWILTEKHLTCL